MSKKNNNLQPLLDYFDMLKAYEQKGYLQLEIDKHEAYVTQTALHAMTPGDDPQQQLQDGSITDTVRYIRTLAAYRAAAAKGLSMYDPKTVLDPDTPLPTIPTVELMAYFDQPFAIHVVRDEPPHDPIYTLVITHRKSWRTLWQWRDNIEVIDYQSDNNE